MEGFVCPDRIWERGLELRASIINGSLSSLNQLLLLLLLLCEC